MGKASVFLILFAASLRAERPVHVIKRPPFGPSLASVKLRRVVRQRIEKVVLLDNLISAKYDQEDAKQDSPVSCVRLGSNRKPDLLVWGGGSQLCGKSNCLLWIFDPLDGALLFQGDGYDLSLRETSHNGHFDIQTKHQLGATSVELDVYYFEQKRYERVESKVLDS